MHIPNDMAIIAIMPISIIFSAMVSTKTKRAAGQGYSPVRSIVPIFIFSVLSIFCLFFETCSKTTCRMEKRERAVSKIKEKPSMYMEASCAFALIEPLIPLKIKANKRATPAWLKARVIATIKGSKQWEHLVR